MAFRKQTFHLVDLYPVAKWMDFYSNKHFMKNLKQNSAQASDNNKINSAEQLVCIFAIIPKMIHSNDDDQFGFYTYSFIHAIIPSNLTLPG